MKTQFTHLIIMLLVLSLGLAIFASCSGDDDEGETIIYQDDDTGDDDTEDDDTNPDDDDDTTPDEDDEVPANCQDGLDNDEDGWIDEEDPDCQEGEAEVGYGDTQCNDCVDNDGDELVDKVDPGCEDAFDDSENESPSAAIVAPEEGFSFFEGDPVTFEGQAADPEDGELSGDSLVWTSNIEGQIGTGGSFSTAELSSGNHTITLTAADSQGAEGTASTNIEAIEVHVLFFDDFESYDADTFPSFGGWELIHSGWGAEHQVIDTSEYYSGAQSFKLEGAPNWAATVQVPFSSPDPLPGAIYYQCHWKVTEPEYPMIDQYPDARIWLKSNTGGPEWFAVTDFIVNMSDDTRFIQFQEKGKIQNVNLDQWYMIRVKANMVDSKNPTGDLWLDGELIASEISLEGTFDSYITIKAGSIL